MDGSSQEASPFMTTDSTNNRERSETAYVLSVILFNGFGSLVIGSAVGLLAFAISWLACGLSISMSATIGAVIGCCVFALVLFAALTQGCLKENP